MKSYSLAPSNYCILVEHNTLLKLHVGWCFQNKHIPASFPLADALRSKKLAEDTANCRFIQPVSHGVLDQQTTALIPSPTDYQDPVRSKHFHAPWPPRFCNSFLIQITQNTAFFSIQQKENVKSWVKFKALQQPNMDHWPLKTLHTISALLISWPGARSGCCWLGRGRLLSGNGSRRGSSAVLGRTEKNISNQN